MFAPLRRRRSELRHAQSVDLDLHRAALQRNAVEARDGGLGLQRRGGKAESARAASAWEHSGASQACRGCADKAPRKAAAPRAPTAVGARLLRGLEEDSPPALAAASVGVGDGLGPHDVANLLEHLAKVLGGGGPREVADDDLGGWERGLGE